MGKITGRGVVFACSGYYIRGAALNSNIIIA
jgi:hypothetical protein